MLGIVTFHCPSKALELSIFMIFHLFGISVKIWESFFELIVAWGCPILMEVWKRLNRLNSRRKFRGKLVQTSKLRLEPPYTKLTQKRKCFEIYQRHDLFYSDSSDIFSNMFCRWQIYKFAFNGNIGGVTFKCQKMPQFK